MGVPNMIGVRHLSSSASALHAFGGRLGLFATVVVHSVRSLMTRFAPRPCGEVALRDTQKESVSKKALAVKTRNVHGLNFCNGNEFPRNFS
jgi:hypothetical protein